MVDGDPRDLHVRTRSFPTRRSSDLPHAAIIGPSSSDTRSPTPPVECLSSTGPGRLSERHSSTCPDAHIAWVKATRSSMFMSLKYTARSEEHTSELQSLMRISYAVFCLTKKNNQQKQ